MTDELTVNPFYLRDPYREFLKTEGVPVYEDVMSTDLTTLELGPWERLGGSGAYVHIPGRGDFVTCYVAEIPAGGQLKPEKHLYDEIIYVVAGRGATTIEVPGGRASFEWGTGSLFAIPLNARHQLFNGSGTEPARFVALTSLPISINLYHNERFIFDNPFEFTDRMGEARYYKGEGEFREVMAGRHQWETNFVPDLRILDTLKEWPARGAGGRSIMFSLAESTLHAHVSEFPQGTYKKAHRRPTEAGVYIICVSGHGYSLLWEEDEPPTSTLRADWKPGTLFCNGAGEHYHQHFNTATNPSRYLALGFGGVRYPTTESKRHTYSFGVDRSVKQGGRQIEYEDEDPSVRDLFERELRARGLESHMPGLVTAG
jgi:quercetin dioxygenase-like cupin family protein